MEALYHRRITPEEQERRWRLVAAVEVEQRRHNLSDKQLLALLQIDEKSWLRWTSKVNAPVGKRFENLREVLTLLHKSPVGTRFIPPQQARVSAFAGEPASPFANAAAGALGGIAGALQQQSLAALHQQQTEPQRTAEFEKLVNEKQWEPPGPVEKKLDSLLAAQLSAATALEALRNVLVVSTLFTFVVGCVALYVVLR